MILANKYLKQNFILINLLFLFILILSPVQAQSDPLEIHVTTDEWPPFRMIKDDKYTGIDFDLLREVAKRMDRKLVLKQHPWSRGLTNMKQGHVDLMSGLAKTEQRALFLDYTSDSYFKCSTVFYVRKGDAKLIENYEDLKNQRVGFVAGSAYFTRFDTDESLAKYSVTSEEQLIKMLVYNRFKVIIGTDCQADYDITRLGYSDKIEKAIYKPNNSVDLYIGISKKSELSKEINKINNIIREIIQEGKIQEFSQQYYK